MLPSRLSLRCCSGTPPSAHNAFCRPSASATKLSPPSTTWACSKPENASRKLVQPVIERLTRNRDAEPGHVGEVGQAHPSRRMLLAEDHIAVGTVRHLLSGDAALQCPAQLPGPTPGCRRQISSKIATARMPGAASIIGTISLSHTPASGSGRRRPRGFFFWMAAADRFRSDRRWPC